MKRAVLHSRDGSRPSIIVEQGDIWRGRLGQTFLAKGVERSGKNLFARFVHVVRSGGQWAPEDGDEFRVFCPNLRSPNWTKVSPPPGQVEMERPT